MNAQARHDAMCNTLYIITMRAYTFASSAAMRGRILKIVDRMHAIIEQFDSENNLGK